MHRKLPSTFMRSETHIINIKTTLLRFCYGSGAQMARTKISLTAVFHPFMYFIDENVYVLTSYVSLFPKTGVMHLFTCSLRSSSHPEGPSVL